MIKPLDEKRKNTASSLKISEAAFPVPFPAGLEYSSPARGCWNIAHMGMLIPDAHEIFICGKGCLRGVVLTAAEMGAIDRYSAVEVREENLLKGNIETLMIDGVADVLAKLPYRPRAVLIYVSCQQFFLGYDQAYVYRILRERHPDIDFLDCYMIPTLRKSGITPDQLMRRQLYRLIKPCEKKKKIVALIGSDLPLRENSSLPSGEGCNLPSGERSGLPLSEGSDLAAVIRGAGWELMSIHSCETYEDYQKLGQASCNIFYEPATRKAAEDMKRRLGQEYLYLPFVYQAERLEENYRMLTEFLKEQEREHSGGTTACEHAKSGERKTEDDSSYNPCETQKAAEMSAAGPEMNAAGPEMSAAGPEMKEKNIGRGMAEITRPGSRCLAEYEKMADAALARAQELIGDTPVAVDYTFTFRILSFTRLLLEHGFHVTEIFIDAFLPEEKEDFEWIRANHPDIRISPTAQPQMRFLQESEGNILAIGQKAAFFCGTDHFVNVAESGGYYGFDGIVKIADLMIDAFLHEKDREKLIRQKGYGCSCLIA